VAILVIVRVYLCPGAPGRRGLDGSSHARIHARYEVQLPGAPLDLPNSKRGKEKGTEQAKQDEEAPLSSRCGHKLLAACAAMLGIMFELRWYIIHNEPAIVMINRMAVKM